jgi:hypothetical protein
LHLGTGDVKLIRSKLFEVNLKPPRMRSSVTSSDDALAHCVQDQLRHAVQIQLLQNVSAMRLGGVDAETQIVFR